MDLKNDLPDFFTPGRAKLLREAFDHMDADGELSLDINELAPFYHYTFIRLFDQRLNSEQVECLFHLMDMVSCLLRERGRLRTVITVGKQITVPMLSTPLLARMATPSLDFRSSSCSWRF